ncbi:type-F conjugative transfer system pilin assembly protein TraF [Budviciaceae bacterium BWR-B9]|uniref:Type-F conjugative transfer system pilin assembly protein TraF n=1 Tax=Limnobaculum allomyrinae TaxID=2791986 RepID=A0ABS1IUW2_9GAMM|nr:MULTISPECIES: type-F conjugative transfer system pilin assembly protein TraF [Limnobaculum]MBK5145539.1 type-F conjugative transfer system pilin assembly protein TraF [Limnobaculum allomyrinae]MBV7693658.1 type-F conjugative transfer system pilin assembly protein TraF [Limnobaculum sp. M2-1]
MILRHSLSMLVTLSLISSSSYASEGNASPDLSYHPQGWQWYTEPPKPLDEEETPLAPSVPMTPSQEKDAIQKETQAALDTAILYPSPENIRRYRLLQDFWTNKAGAFTKGWEKTNLLYPELDYNLQYSHYNGTAGTQQATDRALENAAISELADQYGVFFFYRGNEPIDKLMGSVIKSFCDEHKIAVMPVTMDGVIHPAFPRSRKNQGQAEHMKIMHFPALYLFDTKTENYRPLSYGFKSQDDLARSFYNVATDFKPNF